MADLDTVWDRWTLRIDTFEDLDADRLLGTGGVHLRGKGSGVEFDQGMGWIFTFAPSSDLLLKLETFATPERAREAAYSGPTPD